MSPLAMYLLVCLALPWIRARSGSLAHKTLDARPPPPALERTRELSPLLSSQSDPPLCTPPHFAEAGGIWGRMCWCARGSASLVFAVEIRCEHVATRAVVTNPDAYHGATEDWSHTLGLALLLSPRDHLRDPIASLP